MARTRKTEQPIEQPQPAELLSMEASDTEADAVWVWELETEPRQ